jgi:hypothetical protein
LQKKSAYQRTMETIATTTCTIIDATTTECISLGVDYGLLFLDMLVIIIMIMMLSAFIIEKFVINKNKRYY